MGDFHAIEVDGSSWRLAERGGDCRPVGPAVVKETILEFEQMNSVSMPSALFVEAGAGAGLLTGREGSVKLRRTWVALDVGRSACSGIWEEAGDDMVRNSGGHCGPVVSVVLGTKVTLRGQHPATVLLAECVDSRQARMVWSRLGRFGLSLARDGLAIRVEFHCDQRICWRPHFMLSPSILRKQFASLPTVVVNGVFM